MCFKSSGNNISNCLHLYFFTMEELDNCMLFTYMNFDIMNTFHEIISHHTRYCLVVTSNLFDKHI